MIFINQIREKIGVMFGNPETTPGGRALKFYSSCRIDVRRISQIKEGEEVTGQRVRAKVVKNKVAPPFRLAEFDMMHDHGISYEADILDLAMAQKLVTRTGAWFRYGDAQLGQGREKVRDYLKENPKLVERVEGEDSCRRHDGRASRRGRRFGRLAGRIKPHSNKAATGGRARKMNRDPILFGTILASRKKCLRVVSLFYLVLLFW